MNRHSSFRHVILHADDFGMNATVTGGIVEGFAAGLLTSTSVLTNAPAAGLAITAWRRLETQRQSGRLPSQRRRDELGDDGGPFDLGVHLNLTQGRPLTGSGYPDELIDDAGLFLPPGRLFGKLLFGGGRWRESIERELSAQIAWLLDHRLQPTHLNGHQYIEMMPLIADLVPQLARRFSIGYVRAAREPGHWRTSVWPSARLGKCGVSFVKQFFARRFRRRLIDTDINTADAYFGTSHAALIDTGLVDRFLRLAAGCRQIEIGMHPGCRADVHDNHLAGWTDPLANLRPAELGLLCSADLAPVLVAHRVHLGRLGPCARKRLAA